MHIYLFAISFISIMFLLDTYIYKRFLKPLAKEHHKLFLAVPFLLGIMQLSYVAVARVEIVSVPLIFYYLFSLSIGITFILFVVALIYDITLTFSKKIPFDENRRKSIRIIFDITMIIAAFSYLFEAIKGGVKKPLINSVDIEIKNLDNLRIAQLSDMHIGQILQTAFVRECVDSINALHVDMVVITGDLIDGDINEIIEFLQPLKELQSKYGTFYINGNHEYYHGAQAIMDRVKELHIAVLSDESLIIDNRFNLVGLNDLSSLRFDAPRMDIDKAFSKVDKNLATIVLAHQPKMTTLLEDRKYDLMLSGHTHGGQIFPFGFLVMLDQVYLAGLYSVDKAKQIFVSRGTGFWGPPVRILAPSEISLLNIKKHVKSY